MSFSQIIVMLSKAHLTSHSRMSGCQVSDHTIVIIWIMKIFLYSSSVYSCQLFLISSVSVRSIQFLSFIEPIFAWNVPLISLIFLKGFLVFPFRCFPLFLCIDLWERLSYLHLLFFWNSAFKWEYLSFSPWLFTSLLSTAICKASPDSHFAFLHFFSMGIVLIPVSCTMSRISIHS